MTRCLRAFHLRGATVHGPSPEPAAAVPDWLPAPCRSFRAASTSARRPRSPLSCSTSCWSATTVAPAASSRWKPTPAVMIRRRTPIADRRRARPACSARPATSMCISLTACIGAATWSVERSVKAWRFCCGPSSRWRALSACTSCARRAPGSRSGQRAGQAVAGLRAGPRFRRRRPGDRQPRHCHCQRWRAASGGSGGGASHRHHTRSRFPLALAHP